MATNIDAYHSGKHGTWAAIWKKLSHGRNGPIKRRCWTVASAAPTVDLGATTAATYPVQAGDFCYDIANDDAYICTVKVSVTTAATFVKLHA